MQLILESAGPGFTAAYTQLGGLSLSARHHSGKRTLVRVRNEGPGVELHAAELLFGFLQAENLQTASKLKSVKPELKLSG